jgi:hypothetical protein
MAVAMNTNLVLTTGLAYVSLGACVMFVSHRAIYNTASRVVAGYPRVLTALRAKRHDGRFGFVMLMCGIILQVLGASGYSAPLSLWRYPASAALAALVLYGVCRGVASRRIAAAPARPAAARSFAGGLYETRRSMRLREAAQIEAANREQRERARGPRDRSVVYIRQDWERRWWSDKLGVSSDALEAAVRHAGPMIKDVEQYLSTRRAGNHALAA